VTTPPWQPLQDVDVPVGARGRVRQRVVEALAAPPRRRRAPIVVASLAIAGAAAAAVVVVARDPAAPGAPRATAPVAVAEGQRVALAVGQGHASVVGPAEVRIVDGALRIRTGTVETLGALAIAGPRCEAQLDGSAQVSVRGDATQVRVFAGFARVARVDPLCEVIDLTAAPGGPSADGPVPAAPTAVDAPAALAPVDAGVPDAETIVAAEPVRPRPVAPRARVAPPAITAAPPADVDVDVDVDLASPAIDTAPPPPAAAPPAVDPLTAEVEAYRAAVAREAADPVTAVAAWRAVLARWPDGALAEAAALRLIALHGRLGQRAPQQAAARAFLARHPRSARAADVARLLEAP